jgi:Tfp pilus assembly protein PilP
LVADARRDVNKRDPFLSPVVSRISGPGSGCTGGKRCLALDSISLRGIVKAESGMIAVVVNAANKAYFLRENDPVFNGYVAKITGDTVTFKEATQDALGHHSTRDVVKKILVPAV